MIRKELTDAERAAYQKSRGINTDWYIPKIIIQPNLNTDPCVDDIDTKTESAPVIMKIILMGVIVGVILGVIK